MYVNYIVTDCTIKTCRENKVTIRKIWEKDLSDRSKMEMLSRMEYENIYCNHYMNHPYLGKIGFALSSETMDLLNIPMKTISSLQDQIEKDKKALNSLKAQIEKDKNDLWDCQQLVLKYQHLTLWGRIKFVFNRFHTICYLMLSSKLKKVEK